jgi:hypothetical protein
MTGTINLTEKLANFDQHGPPQTVTQFAGLASPARLAIATELDNS